MRSVVAIDVTPCVGRQTGVGRYVRELVGGLAELGAAITGVYQGHHGNPEGIAIDKLSRYDLLGGYIGGRVRLQHALRSAGARIYHATSTIAAPSSSWTGRVVATIHDCWPLTPGAGVDWRTRLLFRHLLGRILQRADMVLCPSRHAADEVRRHGWKGPLEVIPHGIRPPPRGPRRRPPAAPHEPYLLTIGAIEHRKGWDLLVDAERPLPWFHAGPVRYDRGGRIASRMSAGGCRLLGYLPEEERLDWLAHAAVVAIPSRSEGFGYPALEAMAWGVPVIALPDGALPEVLGDAALWSQPDRIGTDVRVLLGDDKARAQLRAAGLARSAAATIEQMARRHVEAYAR